jgi:hypothetical protein
MKKTPLQKLIEIIKSSHQEVDVEGIGICEVLDYHGIEDIATGLLEEERNNLIASYRDGRSDQRSRMTKRLYNRTAEQYFNENYKQ